MNTRGNANRSVRNTKKKLRAELIRLMEEKPMQSITVRELTETADVNRGTFYFHYADIYSMVTEIENEFFEVFNEMMDSEKISGHNGFTVLTEIFSFLSQNHQLCRLLLSPNGDIAFINRIIKFVEEKCHRIRDGIGMHMGQEYSDMFSAFIVYGCIGLFRTWLNSGKKETPEELASLALKIITPAVNTAFF